MDTPQPQADSELPSDQGGRVGEEENTPVSKDMGKGRFGTSKGDNIQGQLNVLQNALDMGQTCILEGEEMPVDVPLDELDKRHLCTMQGKVMPVDVPLDQVSTSDGEEDMSHLSTGSEVDTLSGGESVIFSVDCCPACQGKIKFIQSKGKLINTADTWSSDHCSVVCIM